MNVSKRAYVALQKSVDHWDRLTVCKTVDDFENEGYISNSCPLCKLYAPPERDSFAPCSRACPVVMDTGKVGCDGTPWATASEAIGWYITGRKRRPKTAVNTEYSYLVDLLKRCRITP